MVDKRAIGGLVSFLICFCAGLALAVAITLGKGVFALTELKEVFGGLCDAFFVPGIIILSVGALIRISNGGFFDGIAYGVSAAFRALVPGSGAKKRESYADFKAHKNENRKPIAVKMPFLCGCGFTAVSLIFLVLYYCV